LLDELTSVQISEWEAYDRIDPIGTWRDDFRMAFMSSLVTNLVISVHGKKNAKHTNVMDFMPKWDDSGVKEVKKQSAEDIKKALMEIANAQNKKEDRKKANLSRPPANLKTKK
jgi:hypothetical protein